MATTKIEWAERVWNPVTGCTKVSPGCASCYAERMAKRLKGRYGYPADDPFKVTLHPDRLDQPLKWRKPSRIFVCSMGDVLHDDVDERFIDKIMSVISNCPQHQFLLLTKRPENAVEKINYWDSHKLKNLWLGVTVEKPEYKPRIDILRQIPAAIRFLSLEPLLADLGELNLDGISWVIVGAESGHKRRECKIEWVSDIVDQCQNAGVPVFVKQLHIKRWVSKNMNAWPKYLRIRQYPAAAGKA